jgi:UDP-galactopyranose mutase
MARIALPSQIRAEDFDEKERGVAEKIGGVYNGFSDDVYKQMNGNLTFENLDRQLVTFEVKIDAAGAVLNKPQIKLKLNSKISGLKVISATNLDSATTYPTACPFVSYEVGQSLITIRNVSGLQPNSRYSLTAEIIGS